MGGDAGVDLVAQRFRDACIRRQAMCSHGHRWQPTKVDEVCLSCVWDEGAAVLSRLDALNRSLAMKAGQ